MKEPIETEIDEAVTEKTTSKIKENLPKDLIKNEPVKLPPPPPPPQTANPHSKIVPHSLQTAATSSNTNHSSIIEIIHEGQKTINLDENEKTILHLEESIQLLKETEVNFKQNSKKSNQEKVCGMIIPYIKQCPIEKTSLSKNLIIEPKTSDVPILVVKPKLRSLENIKVDQDIDGQSIPVVDNKAFNSKSTSTPDGRRLPLKNKFKNISIINE